MATTLTVVYTVGLQAFLIHVGDSRAYRFREGRLEQMTRDHTVAQGMLDAGKITAEEVRFRSRRHVLTNVLSGRPGEVEPDVSSFELADRDCILLCSDGLNDMLSDAEIATVLSQYRNPADAVRALIQAANDRGGRDNVTAVLAQYEVRPPKA
jgi:protein phosphatase